MKKASKCKPCPMYSGRDQAGKAWAVCPYSGGFVRHTPKTEQKASSQPDGATGREGSARRPAQTIPAHSRQFWRVYMGFAVNRFIRPFLAFLTFPHIPIPDSPQKPVNGLKKPYTGQRTQASLPVYTGKTATITIFIIIHKNGFCFLCNFETNF